MTTTTITTDTTSTSHAPVQPAPASSKAPNPPSHAAYHVRDGRNGKGFWTRIGSAWQHTDGQGYTVQLDCVPVDGRISLRVASEKKE